jgi:hypothetical protein
MYEYHLEDGTIEISVIPNIISFPRVVYNVWDEEVKDMITEEIEVKVRYCIIK